MKEVVFSFLSENLFERVKCRLLLKQLLSVYSINFGHGSCSSGFDKVIMGVLNHFTLWRKDKRCSTAREDVPCKLRLDLL